MKRGRGKERRRRRRGRGNRAWRGDAWKEREGGGNDGGRKGKRRGEGESGLTSTRLLGYGTARCDADS